MKQEIAVNGLQERKVFSNFASVKRPLTEIHSKKPRRLRVLAKMLALAGAMLLPLASRSQTCRVSCGTNAAGVHVYMEVYEYDYVTEKPHFPGGEEKLLKYINRTREYPEHAYRQGIQGRVMCSFVVMADGSISYVRVLRGVEATLNNEAKRVLSEMPNWKPGKVNGRPVPVRVIYPITFRR